MEAVCGQRSKFEGARAAQYFELPASYNGAASVDWRGEVSLPKWKSTYIPVVCGH